jgi:hypothetical protein
MICTEAIPASPIRDRTFRFIKDFIGAARTAVGQQLEFTFVGFEARRRNRQKITFGQEFE